MRVLLIDVYSSYLDLALRCQEHGHEVRWFQSKTREGLPSRVGNGLIKKVPDWESSMAWADIILLADNVRYIKNLESYRKRGFPIWGPSVETADWELNRQKGQDILSRAGVKTMACTPFRSVGEARKFLLANPGRYVSKPNADDNKAMSYVSKSAKDMMFMLDYWQKNSKVKGDFIFQKFTPGIEVAVGGWFGLGGFVGPWLENFEHKKLMDGEVGVNCYSEDTEVLTKDGWKFWPDVTQDDEICTLRDGGVHFEKPSRLTVGDSDKELIGWQSPYVDILVTPGHQMYVQDDHQRKDFWFESANITENKSRVILRGAGEWVGEDGASQLPAFYSGGFKEWCALLGAYIADGSISGRTIRFGNCPEHKQGVFTEIAQAAGFSAKMYGPDLCINSKSLADHFSLLGKSHEKRAPAYVKNAPRDAILAFLSGYGTGDGTTRPNNLVYTTVSKDLADDLQELCLKAGYCANIKTRDRRGESHTINGYECVNRHVSYDVYVSQSRMKANLTPETSYRTAYTGKVYCCTVTSHVIYVRRNGKACFLGQTGEMGTVLKYTENSLLADMLLRPLEGELYRQGYTGYIDVSVIVSERGDPLPLEFTCRPGWPLQQILQCLHKGDPVTWMVDALNGKDSVKVSDEIAAGVVMTIPDFPYSRLTKKEVSGYPVYGWDKMPARHFHPCEMMVGPVWEQDGDKLHQEQGLVTAGDYVCVVTGSGDTVQDAQEQAYTHLKRIELPNSPMYRTDIGDRLKDQLPKLQAHGFCEDWTF